MRSAGYRDALRDLPGQHQIARLAVARLFERLEGAAAPPAAQHVAYRLAIRESTAG